MTMSHHLKVFYPTLRSRPVLPRALWIIAELRFHLRLLSLNMRQERLSSS
jgi:hypothetical protein